MKLMTRLQFIEHMEAKFKKPILADHPVFTPEHEAFFKHDQAKWFVVSTPINIKHNYSYDDQQRYWDWCRSNMSGSLACYYSDPKTDEEYWGFAGPESDPTLWIMRWAS
ncbi:hypothetical protein UFOVP116_230 [uncultured Caudovirales phage]|uniref:Uncharacterized protein n=1 Tax=uncultured Caudovirales phage TaxID=2100421 RepID=A0A6J5L6K7_9CAUD|nr:hypothetical protein UFOVP116_230 [uncultured Caudovirales phage]